MSSNYDGDPTATQAPSDPPGEGTAPTVVLPSDGDAANAASVAQAFKVVADFIAWAQSPFPRSGTALSLPTVPFKNAKGHHGLVVDHWGLIDGPFTWTEEDWTERGDEHLSPPDSPGAAVWNGRWNYGLFGSAAQVYNNGPWGADLSTHPWGAIAGAFVVGGGPGGSCALIEAAKPWALCTGSILVMDLRFTINGATAPKTSSSFAVGFGDGSFAGGSLVVPILSGGAAVPGSYVCVDPNDNPAVLKVVSRPAGGGASGTNSAVAVARDTPYHWRCVVLGATGADDSAFKVIHYINDMTTPVATHAQDMGLTKVVPFIRTTSIGASTEDCGLNVGRIRVAHRIELT